MDENKTVHNYNGPVYNNATPPTGGTTTSSNNDSSNSGNFKGLYILAAIIILSIAAYAIYHESKKPDHIMEMPDGSGLYDISTHTVVKIDQFEKRMDVLVDTAQIYSNERVAIFNAKNNCQKKVSTGRSHSVRITPPFIINNYVDQGNNQEVTNPEPEKKEDSPKKEDPPKDTPEKEKKKCNPPKIGDMHKGNNKDINQ